MRDFSVILRPLADKIVDLYMSFLPRLVYPVRAGEHANTAFGLVFALEYARKGSIKSPSQIRVYVNGLLANIFIYINTSGFIYILYLFPFFLRYGIIQCPLPLKHSEQE